MTTLYVDNIAPNLQSRVSVPGHVIQVLSNTITGPQNFSVNADTESGTIFSQAITPTSTSSKILIIANVQISCETPKGYLILNRDGTDIAIGDAASTRKRVTSHFYSDPDRTDVSQTTMVHFLDSPSSTTEITYSITARHGSSVATTIYVNRNEDDTDEYKRGRMVSTITLMEIAG